jgi:hypothetical protein
MSFTQGMVERPTSEVDYTENTLKFQAPQSRSALYIENYDPTIVPGALTKRKGMALARSILWTKDAGLVDDVGLPQGFGQSLDMAAPEHVINLDIERFTLLIDQDPSNIETSDKATLLGTINVPYNKPAQQTVQVVFVRDITTNDNNRERTRIVALCKQTPTQTRLWRNPHIAGGTTATGSLRTSPSPSTYAGWEVTGTLADATRHGGTVVFTTNVATELWPHNGGFNWSAAWVSDMYPCYVWTYWDLRRKRIDSEFWNVDAGLDNQGNPKQTTVLADLGTSVYNVDDKYSIFKVMTPSLWAPRTGIIEFRHYPATVPLHTGELNDNQWMAQNYPALLADTPTKPIEISILETPSRTYTPSRPYVVWSQNDPPPYENEKLTPSSSWYADWMNDDVEFITSIEPLKVGTQYAVSAQLQDNYYQGTLWFIENPPSGGFVITDPHSAGANKSQGNWAVTKGTWEGVAGGGRRSVVVITATRYYQTSSETYDNWYEDVTKEYYTAYVAVALPNYLENNNPRYWLAGEKVPVVVTLKIRGIEVVGGEHVHTVARSNYAPNLELFTDNVKGAEDKILNYDVNRAVLYASRDATRVLKQKSEDKISKLNGSALLPVLNPGWYFNAANDGSQPKWVLYSEFLPYEYEPFNPTASGSFQTDPSQNYNDKYYHNPVRYDAASASLQIDGESPGYRRRHTSGTMVSFTVKIRKDQIGALLELGLEAINIYVAQPGQDSILRSKGTDVVEDADQGIYMLPDTEDTDEYSKYKLVKSFLLDGKGSPYANWDDTIAWQKQYKGLPVATNAWHEAATTIIACGQQKDGTPNHRITPDFMLWDYPTLGKQLLLNSSGDYWQGKGAGVISVIKGRTFLGACIDENGEDEQGIIRYSDIQSGVISLDVFSKENYIKLGGNPHTAMIEFREQLWAFSRQEVYRMQMPSITDITTWEYLDKYPGQGTFSPKTVIGTPFGVFWCNEAGVWSSDGRIPENIATPVLTVYQTMASTSRPYYATKFSFPSFPYNEQGINPYLELSYDEENNELVVSSPRLNNNLNQDFGATVLQSPEAEVRLVFDFDTQTWRVESFDHQAFNTTLNEFDRRGTVSFDVTQQPNA